MVLRLRLCFSSSRPRHRVVIVSAQAATRIIHNASATKPESLLKNIPYPWRSISPDAEPAPQLSPIRVLATTAVGHPSLVSLLAAASAAAAIEGVVGAPSAVEVRRPTSLGEQQQQQQQQQQQLRSHLEKRDDDLELQNPRELKGRGHNQPPQHQHQQQHSTLPEGSHSGPPVATTGAEGPPLEPRHLLAAFLRVPELCPPLTFVLMEAGFPSDVATAQLLGHLPPPHRTQHKAAATIVTQTSQSKSGRVSADERGRVRPTEVAAPAAPAVEEAAHGDSSEPMSDVLGPESISAWRSLDSALEDSNDREIDFEVCGFAASRAAQRVLLQAYRWAMFSGSADVRPVHVAHALLVQACFSRFRTGVATDGNAASCLERFSLLPGSLCNKVIAALQEDMQSAAAAAAAAAAYLPPPPTSVSADGGGTAVPALSERKLRSPYLGTDAAATATAAVAVAAGMPIDGGGGTEDDESHGGGGGGQGTLKAPAAAEAAAAAAEDLLDKYGISGLLPSRGVLDAIAASLESSSTSTSTALEYGVPALAAVRILCDFAALGYALPQGACRTLSLLQDTKAQNSCQTTSVHVWEDISARGKGDSDTNINGGGGSDIEMAAAAHLRAWWACTEQDTAADAAITGCWMTPQLLSDWLYALAFHGLAPHPAGHTGYADCMDRTTCTTEGTRSEGGHDSIPVVSCCVLPCHPALQRSIMACLARATAWELPSLAARLAALAVADPGWRRCGARATELACRTCLSITPLWNGNKIYQDLINLGDALMAMGNAATSAIIAADKAHSVLTENWLPDWAAAELPHQIERWGRKLAARVHKGATVGLRDPLPREPEWPTFEQAAVLLLQAVRLTQVASVLASDPPSSSSSSSSMQRRLSASVLRSRGITINLLAILQMQLRTCAAGPQQLQLVRLAVQELEGQVRVPIDPIASLHEMKCQRAGVDVGDIHVARYATWIKPALAAYAAEGCGTFASSQPDEDVVALLPSIVLGQIYRNWIPDLSHQVAAVLHSASTALAAAATNTSPPAPSVTTRSSAQQQLTQRCMARLHFPLGYEDVGSLPRHVPYTAPAAGGGQRCGSATSHGAISPLRYLSPSLLVVAQPYPDMRNLSTLPSLLPLLPQQQQSPARGQPGLSPSEADILAGSKPGNPLRLLLSYLVTGLDASGAADMHEGFGGVAVGGSAPYKAAGAAADCSAGISGEARSPAATTRCLLLPPGSKPRTLQLHGADLVALASELMLQYPPESLRPEEVWVLHVADRDAALSKQLRAAATAVNTTPSPSLPTIPSMSFGADPAERLRTASVADAWEAWMDAAVDAQLTADVSLWKRSPPALMSQLLDRDSVQVPRTIYNTPIGGGNSFTSVSIPQLSTWLISIPANSPPATSFPSLPPICRLELLLQRGRYSPIQSLLALMWQGDWFRGDVATLARFSAEELLYVMCAIVHLKELEELAEVDLDWLSGDTAAEQVLQLLTIDTMEGLLASPAVAWGVRPTGPYAPSDLTQEKRVRSQKLLDAAVGLDEYFDRAQQALKYVATVGQSGVLGGGRLDPYRTMDSQGESVTAFQGHRWLAETAAAAAPIWMEQREGGREPGVAVGGRGDGSIRQEGEEERRGQMQKGGALRQQEGVSIWGLRARRPADTVREWERVLGMQGVVRLRSALVGMGYDPEKWMAQMR